MKSKILLVCIILGLFTTVKSIYAKGTKTPDYSEVINNYVDACVNGSYKKLDKVLSEDANVKIPRAGVVLVHSKNKLIEQMRRDGPITQACESTYEVLEKSDAIVIAKVNFKYKDFTQYNYLTLEKDDNKEWKITQVCRFFDEVKQPGSHPASGVIVEANKANQVQ